MHKAVVLGCNYYIGLSIIRCLGRQGVHVVACDYDLKNSYGAKSKYISEFLEIKELAEVNEVTLTKLLQFGKAQAEKPVLLPSHDKYVEFIDRYYDKLSEYFLISQAPNSLNSKLMDKVVLHKIASEHGVLVPESFSVDEENLLEKVEKIGYPCIIKPSDTVEFTKVFRSKVFLCENPKKLQEGIEKAKKHNVEVFVQQIIPGFDDHMLTYDYYINKQGKTTHYMTAQKQRQWPINFGASVFTQQKYLPELVSNSKNFLESIGYQGFGEIEYKKHEKTGEVYLIEINVRTTNFNNLIYKLGINMPYIAYLELTGQESKIKNKYVDYDTRYAFIYGYEDLLSILKYAKTGQISLFKSFFKILGKRLAPAIFSVTDLKPWFNFNKKLFRKFFRKIR